MLSDLNPAKPAMWDQQTTISDDGQWSTEDGRWERDERELPLWVVGLDNAAMLIMTGNTVTLMLGMGAATYWREFWEHLKRPWACLIGIVCQFALLPAIGFGFALAFHLPPYQAVGVLILACSPGGAFSNFFTYWVNGDLALSIMMTALSAILAFGAMPFNLWVYAGRWTDKDNLVVPYFNILISLLFVTIPVLVGMVIRHFSRRWASYISKVCAVLGWMGAVVCGVLLVLRYWHTIVTSSLDLVFTATLLPLAGVTVSYILTKILCFSHKICRTVAIETACQNMVVATSIILLSFPSPKVRGHMIIYPVLYGLCQLAEVAVVTAIFQVWVCVHRDAVTEEDVASVLDTTILTSVPVPAHKLSEARMEEMMRHTQTTDNRSTLKAPPPYSHGYEEKTFYHADESQVLLSPNSPDSVDHNDQVIWTRGHKSITYSPHTHLSHTSSLDTPPPYCLHQDQDSPNSMNWNLNLDLDPEQIIESAYSYDSDVPASPALSNKGVPNMFPVTEKDFPADRENSSTPYGSPVPSYRSWSKSDSGRRADNWNGPGSPPTSPTNFNPSPSSTILTSPTSPTNLVPPTSPVHRPSSPDNPSTLSDCQSPSFNFYHQDVRLGQARQLGTFGRKN